MFQGNHDLLLHRGRLFELVDRPLENYFDLIGQRPSLRGDATATEPPYTARWQIDDGWLYLTGLSGSWEDGAPLTIAELFPLAGTRVFAAWFSGALRGYRADAVQFGSELGGNGRYPDIFLQVTCGRLKASSVVHRSPGRQTSPDVVGAALANGLSNGTSPTPTLVASGV